MTLTIVVGDKLIEEARLIGKHQTESEAVVAALTEYIERRQQQKIIDLFGTIEYEADYNYKEQRNAV